MSIRKFLAAAALAVLGFAASVAHGALLLSATIGGVPVCSVDNNLFVCTHGAQLLDANPSIGLLGLNQVVVGGVDVFGSLQTSTKGAQNILSSSSLQLINTTGAPINASFAVGDNNFVPPVTSASTSGSGTWVNAAGSSISMFWYDDPTNQQGAETPFDRPGFLLDSFADFAGPGTDSFSDVGGPFAVNDPNPFSMTMAFDAVLLAGGRLEGRSMAEIKPQGVPEPTPIALLAAGILGLALLRRRNT